MSTKIQKFSIGISVVCILIAIVLLTYNMIYDSKEIFEGSKEMSYPDFQECLENGDINTILYSSNDEYMYFNLFSDISEGSDEDGEIPMYKTLFPATSSFREDMLKRGINLQVIKEEKLSDEAIVYIILIILVASAIIYFTIKSILKNSADIKSMIQNPDAKFSDVIGLDEVIEEVKFAVDYLRAPAKYEKVGVRMPSGILFHGEPGTGKTLLARAIAGEADVPFIYATIGDLTSSFQAGGSKKINNLFKGARKIAPCIVFIDEIDAIGMNRGMLGSSEANQTLNALLSELDGFNKKTGVLVIATTNCIERLDPALIRSGRFDRKLRIKTPSNSKIRKQMFEHFLSKYSCEEEVLNSLDVLARETIGCTGADIETICNEAGILAIRGQREKINFTDLEDAYDNHLIQGCKRLDDFDETEKHRIAVHESGHVLMAHLSGIPIARVIVAKSTSDNATYTRLSNEGDSDHTNLTREDLEKRLRINYAGRAAEELVLGTCCSGACADLDEATSLIKRGVSGYGLFEEYGVLCSAKSLGDGFDIARDKEVYEMAKKLSKKYYEQTVDTLLANLDKLEMIYKEVEKTGVLSGARLSFMLGDDSDNA